MSLLAAVQSPRHSASSGVLPDLLPPHTPPQSRSPQNVGQRPQDKTTSDEVRRQRSFRHSFRQFAESHTVFPFEAYVDLVQTGFGFHSLGKTVLSLSMCPKFLKGFFACDILS